MPATSLRVSEAKAAGISIRSITDPEEMHACVAVERAVWGFSAIDVVPQQVFVLAARTGGQVIGAFDGERVIGFVLAIPAVRGGRSYIHSHMAAVLPEYQNLGIGKLLKFAQREDALARGFDLIEWTFDPLQLKNAHFNIVALGVSIREYLPNFYGQTSSPLHYGIPTDRLVAQWRIREQSSRRGSCGRREVSIPANIVDLCHHDPQQGLELQSQIRHRFQQLFSDAFVITDFEFDRSQGKYLLEKQ